MTEEAAATATTTDAATATGTQEAATATDTPLGPEGEKALAAFKARARTAENEAKELRERLDTIEESTKSETDKALDKARKEAKAEATAEFETQRRTDRLAVAVAAHARDLADIDDVISNLEREDGDVFDKDGKVDRDRLKAALDDLLKRKPHLKAVNAGKPQGTADGGEGEGGEGGSFNDQLRANARR